MLLYQSSSRLSSIPKSITSYRLTNGSSTKSYYVSTTLSYCLIEDLSQRTLSYSKDNSTTINLSATSSSQPSKQSSSLAENLDPIELIFFTPPTSPHPFFDSLEDLPSRTTNPPPPQPLFKSIKHFVTPPKSDFAAEW
nr:hypothetical protein [Tanacetum cinerariifolium]